MRRSKSIRAIAFVTAFALLSAPVSTAVAQPAKAAAKAAPKKKLRDSLTVEARDAFDRGVQLYNNKNFEGAVAEFDRAYGLSKDPRLLYNMAIADRDAKRYGRAVNRLDQELKEGADSLSADEKKAAQDLLEGLKQFTAPLTVTVNEADATILVDGAEVGKSPLAQPVVVDVGERTVVARKAGFTDVSKRVTIASGKPEKLDLSLEATLKKGKLVVRAQGAPAATVVVDGVEQGAAPWEGEVSADKHTVEVRARGYVTESRTQDVAAKSTSVLEVSLRPAQGKVRIESDKAENVINVDGKEVGRGTWEGTLPSGLHRIDVTRSGTEPYGNDLTVETDQQRTLKVVLRPLKGGVPWYAWVIGGAVLIGGGIGTYFLAKPGTKDPQPGTINPGTVPVGFRF